MSAVDLPSSLSIDVVIPTFNGWDLTRSCLEHLGRQTVSHTVIVAENASSDGTPRNVRSTFPEARLVELYRNRGFAAACNHGVRGGSGDVVVLLNNDVDCPPDFVERLGRTAPERGRIGYRRRGAGAAGRADDRQRRSDRRYHPRRIPAAAWTPCRRSGLDEARADRTGRCSRSLPARRMGAGGGLDEGVFMYGEASTSLYA